VIAQYELHLYSNTGVYLGPLRKRITSLKWETHLGGLGHFELTLSDRLQPVDVSKFQKNGRVAIWRKAAPGAMDRLEMIGFIRDKHFRTDERGVTRYTFAGPDQNDLLNIRQCHPWHPYTAGFWHPNHYGYADNLMRELVEDNLGAGSSNEAARDLVTSNTAGLTIAIESSATATACTTAGQMNVEHGGKLLLQQLQEMHLISLTYKQQDVGTAAVKVWYNLCADTDTTLTFRVRPTRWGMNHRSDSGSALPIGMSYGNLRVPEWNEVSSNEVNAGISLYYAMSYSSSSWALDQTRIDEAPLNRREAAATASDGDTGTVATQLINEGKPVKEFKGIIQDTPGCRYGVHWGDGDELTVDYLGLQYNVIVMGKRVECKRGRERIEPIMEVQDA
jgi:hypothetical protein